jgi:hypothetical protein
VLSQEWVRDFDAWIENVQHVVKRLGGDTLKQVFNERLASAITRP